MRIYCKWTKIDPRLGSLIKRNKFYDEDDWYRDFFDASAIKFARTGQVFIKRVNTDLRRIQPILAYNIHKSTDWRIYYM